MTKRKTGGLFDGSVGSSVIVLPFMVFVICLKSSRLLRGTSAAPPRTRAQAARGREQPNLDQREQLVERHHRRASTKPPTYSHIFAAKTVSGWGRSTVVNGGRG
jgi:hypothetical protein